ncbi:hypothetical protein ACFX12_040148 [Malus domestica]
MVGSITCIWCTVKPAELLWIFFKHFQQISNSNMGWLLFELAERASPAAAAATGFHHCWKCFCIGYIA